MIILLSLALLGLVSAIYLTALHYKQVDSISLCELGEKASCETVSDSPYSEILNVPVSILGAFGYAFFAIIAFLNLKRFDFKKINKKLNPKLISGLYFYVVLLAFLFSLYLTYIELNVIYVVCPMCILSQILIVIMLFFSYLYHNNLKLIEKKRG